MAGLSAAALSVENSLRTQAVAGVVEALFRNNEVMGEFTMRPFTGGGTINVKMHYAGNTSVGRYSEGDADGVAGSQSYLTAYWPEQHYRGQVGITGHARDYTLNGSMQAVFFDQLAQEMERVYTDITDFISVDMLGTGLTAPVGIQGIIDSAGTIATLSRSTYAWFQAYETTGAGTTIAMSDLDNATYQSAETSYAAKITAIWTTLKQSSKYKGVAGNMGTTASPLRVIVDGPGPVQFNTGSVMDDQFYGAVPIKKKHNLDSSVWLGLTTSRFFIGKMRDWTVRSLPFQGDTDRYQVTCAFSLGCDSPRENWKVTGLTA
jgi:hypothetical protein